MTTPKPNRRNHRLNQLRRYQKVMEEFNKYDCTEIPITVIWRKYIYPKFFISRHTLYRIFNTPIEEELASLTSNNKQLSLFDFEPHQ